MGTYEVERRASINADAPTIRALVEDFHEWPKWSPWEDLDPELERTYSGPDSGVGAHYAWRGNRKAGAGSMEITGQDEGGVEVALSFLKPFKSESTLHFSFVPAGADATEVVWQMTGITSGVSGLMTRFMNFDKLVGPDFEKGLTRLKGVAEATG